MQQRSLIHILTPKQFRVTILVAQGLNDQVIDKVVGQTSEVIRSYVRCLLDEVRCVNRLELAIRFAHELHQAAITVRSTSHICALY